MQVASSTSEGDQPHANSSEGGHGANSHSGPLVVFIVFFGLLCGTILREVNKRFGIPYTPMLLVFGMVMGYFSHSMGFVGESADLLAGMNPHMILLVFIPILIFQSAYNCDWHVFKRSIFSILVLAGPGVLFGAFLIAFIFKGILLYGDEDLTWFEACALGCVLSATDPVAVVALLKELGASVKFNTLVEGESLLNDGTAMVFFMVFMKLVKGQTATISGVIVNFVRVSIGGPILGIVIGFLACLWAKTIIRDSVLTVMITFMSAFLCFYIAEFSFLKVSGILSLVALGLYFSAVGKRKINHESQHDLHSVWASIQYAAETILFILTGLVVGGTMLTSDQITAMDWFKMIIFWFLMILSRGIMVFACAPILKKSGYGLSMKQIIVLIYGGLRGALGMCLALFVGVDDTLRDRFRHITVFYMCGMAMLTIIVNGLTCSKLVNYLQMIKEPEIKNKLLQICLKKVLGQTQTKLQQLKYDPNLSYAKWKQVQKTANVNTLGTIVYEKQRNSKMQQLQPRISYKTVSKNDLIAEIRFRFIRYLSRIFWEYYENGQLSEQSIQALDSCSNIVNDEIETKLRNFEILSSFFSLQSIEMLIKFKNSPIIGGYIAREILQKIYFVYEVSTVFVQACQEVLQKFEQSFPVHVEQLRYVFDEVRENIENASSFINELENNYPNLIQAVHTQRATTILLVNKKHKLTQLFELGYIDAKYYNLLRGEIDIALVNNRNNNTSIEQIKYSEIVTQCPIFSSLNPQEMLNLRIKCKEKIYQKSDIVLAKGNTLNSCQILISGCIKQQFKNFYFMRSIGSIVNPFDFTYKQGSKCQAKARNTVKILQVQSQFIQDLLKNNAEFRKRWYKSLFMYCKYHYKGLEDIYENCHQSKLLRRFIQAGEVIVLPQKQEILLQDGGFVFNGSLSFENTTIIRGSYVMPQKTIVAQVDSIIMKFKMIKEISKGHLHGHGGRNSKNHGNSQRERADSLLNQQFND